VNIRSLKGCLPWENLQKQPFYYKTFHSIGHTEILKRSVVIEYLREIQNWFDGMRNDALGMDRCAARAFNALIVRIFKLSPKI
jgi:hypothetical protein